MDALLNAHCPIYNFDYREPDLPMSLEAYVATKQFVRSDTATGIVKQAGNGDSVLHYFLFFERDGGTVVDGKAFDAHPFDIEQVSVRVTKHGVVNAVYFYPHSAVESFAITGTDLDKVLQEGHPIVYIAYGKHASYPVPYVSRYLMAGDECLKPVRYDVKAVQASNAVMKSPGFGAILPLSRRIVRDLETIPVVPLALVSTRMRFAVNDKSRTLMYVAIGVSGGVMLTVIAVLYVKRKRLYDAYKTLFGKHITT
ncbi:hypothetical protein JKP88DRAFT_307681 [Tribonema minus]|uniref:Uncharacterized protein n=1 Tax=Tribonema minus TaxID=303371 RepID=A0A836CL76_9STRA|nr:hypothetical protein JKP88DRAFT_307681 [Tribonema minus]